MTMDELGGVTHAAEGAADNGSLHTADDSWRSEWRAESWQSWAWWSDERSKSLRLGVSGNTALAVEIRSGH